ncbi:MAG: hypothetical protein D6830_06575 [Ignavibacteria bacterium]|nr:MAG: hypothetical protein D6830_06575 [Ignavibacteria bacterium]
MKRSGFDASNRFQMLEKIFFYLPQNFTVTTGLQFLNSAYVGLKDDRITLDMGVKHKLYESLVSNAYVSFTESNQSIVIEKTIDAGFSFDYSKKIPTGTLNLNYSFDRESKSDKGQLTVNSIRDERHKLEDGVIVLLNNPNVDANSIIVKSPDGLIQYRLNLDYEIYVHDSFYEIRRTLGGQIANGDVVLVDYTTLTDPSFDYTSMNNSYSISLNLFENFLNLSYSGNNLSFGDYSGINNIALRTVNRNVYSGRINLYGATLGFEYDNFESNIVPYQSKRYYAEYGYWEERKILVSLATNYRDYYLVEEKLKQKFFDLVTKLSYSLGFYSKVNLEFTYRVQKGTGIDLNFATGKIELYTLYRAIDIILGGELFNQNYIGQINNYYRTYLKLRRSF